MGLGPEQVERSSIRENSAGEAGLNSHKFSYGTFRLMRATNSYDRHNGWSLHNLNKAKILFFRHNLT
jgi:hypothetical protein